MPKISKKLKEKLHSLTTFDELFMTKKLQKLILKSHTGIRKQMKLQHSLGIQLQGQDFPQINLKKFMKLLQPR